jgi:IPT/TIG domain
MAAPTVTALSPSYGTAVGATSVTITGTGFTGATAVKFGTTNAASFTVDSATSITAVSPAGTPGLSYVYVTNADGTSTASEQFEFVGLFSITDCRSAMDYKLPSTVTDIDILAAETRIREAFQQICDCYFYTTSVTEYIDGTGTPTIQVSEYHPTSITAAVLYDSDGDIDETFDATDLSDCAVYPEEALIIRRSEGNWLSGKRNCKLTYYCGYATVPPEIKRAALMVALTELTYSNVGDRATSYSDGVMSFQLATAGRTNQWYGLPLVDSVLQRHNHTLPGIA